MFSALRRTARSQFTLRHLTGIAVVVGFFALVLDLPRSTLVAFAVALALSEAVTLLRNTPEIDQRYVKAGIGAFVTVGSLGLGYLVLTGASGAPWLPALTLLAGVWFLVDAVSDVRRGRRPGVGADDDLSSAEVMLLMSHGHLVATELEDGPRTVPELAEACDLTESRVEDALTHLERSDVVARRGDRYALRPENLGAVAFARTTVSSIYRRLVRPFRA